MDRLVNFLIIGTQKGGTSALEHYLSGHPQIVTASSKKELHFFDNKRIFAKPVIDYGELEREFEVKEGAIAYGEATPSYMYWMPTIKRIHAYNPDMKLIAILRNPIDRAFSHWNMETARGNEREAFIDCIKNETQRSKEVLPLQHRAYSYADRGYYSRQIKKIARFFPAEQVMYIKYEDFLTHQHNIVNQVFEFLEVDPAVYNYEFKAVRESNYNRRLSEEERECLLNIFSSDISRVEQMLGWDCSDWK